jgi:hypothetical protein
MQTCRDAQIVAWLGRVGAASAGHVRERFDMGRSTTYARLASLTRDGLLEHRTVLYGWPGVYSATAAGLRWQGLERLTVFQVRPGGFEHAWRAASVAVALHRHLPGWEVWGEREIKARELSSECRLLASARIGSIGSVPMLHRPDLAVISPSGRTIAVEVELSVKAQARLVRICRGWARARHLAHVYYLAVPSAARAVGRAVQLAKAGERVSVLALDDVGALATGELIEEEACDVRAA